MTKRITLIPGDGIGIDVTAEAANVLRAHRAGCGRGD
jgi:isocitrate/isopropylmalate dehydrogenase